MRSSQSLGPNLTRFMARVKAWSMCLTGFISGRTYLETEHIWGMAALVSHSAENTWSWLPLASLPGKGDERRAAAALASVLCIQLGPGIESEEVLKTLGPVLKKIICDSTASLQARQSVSGRLSGLTCPAVTPGHGNGDIKD